MRIPAMLCVSALACSLSAPLGLAQEDAGVGVALGREEGEIVVRLVLPKTPAAASKAVHVGDRIIAVAQDKGEEKPVKGMKIGEVVPLLRGPKGTTVRLTIVPAKKPDAQAYVIELTRGELKELAGWGDGALLKKGDPAPDFAFEPVDGGPPGRLSDFAGKVVVLDFGSITCGPCQASMEQMQFYSKIYEKSKDEVVFIGVFALDDDKDAVARYVEAKGWTRTLNVRAGADAMKAFHVNALPTVYIIDQQCRVVRADQAPHVMTIVSGLLKPK